MISRFTFFPNPWAEKLQITMTILDVLYLGLPTLSLTNYYDPAGSVKLDWLPNYDLDHLGEPSKKKSGFFYF